MLIEGRIENKAQKYCLHQAWAHLYCCFNPPTPRTELVVGLVKDPQAKELVRMNKS